MLLRFGEFEIDEHLYQLRHEGAPIRIEPKAFDLLRHLVRHRERVVPRDELLATVWPREHVTASSLSTCVNTVRHLLGDDGKEQRWIQTVRGRGYRFIASLAVSPVEATALTTDTEPLPLKGRPRAALIGRRGEVGRLDATLHALAEGVGGVVVITGEPGIGKSRLAAELAHRAEAAGALVATGIAMEDPAAPAYWPWLQCVRGIADTLPDATLRTAMGTGAAELLDVLTPLRERFPEDPHATPVDGEQGRYRLFDSMARFFRRLASTRPVVLVLEDLHWADPVSALLLRFVTQQIERFPLLVVITCREGELGPDHVLTTTLATVRREAPSLRVALTGLSDDAVRELVREHAAGPVVSAVVEAITRITEGNPFFVLELVDHLRDEGTLFGDEMDGAPIIPVPASVRSILGRRLCRLSPECLRLLDTAAVVGREFDAGLIAAATATPLDAVAASLAEAVDVGVILEQPGEAGRMAFSHALMREALLHQLGALRRSHVHRRIAAALEGLSPTDAGRHVDALAHHFAQAGAAGDLGKAAAYAESAAARAAAVHAYEQAISHLERALELVSEPTRRCRLLLALGEALVHAGRLARAHGVFGQAAASIQSGDARLLAQAVLGHGGRNLRIFGSVCDESVRLVREALAREGLDTRLRAMLQARWASALRHAPEDVTRRTSLALDALERARVEGDPATLAAVLDDVVWALWRADTLPERLALTAELRDLAIAGRDPEMELKAEGWRFAALLEAGDVVAADAARVRHATLANELRLPLYRWDALNFEAARALMAGRLTETERCADAAYASRPYVHPDNADQIYGVQMGFVRHLQGRSEEITGLLGSLEDRHPTCWKAARAMLCAELGLFEACDAMYRPVADSGFSLVPHDSVRTAGLAHLAIAAAELGDQPGAARLYELLLPFAHHLVVISEYGLAVGGSVERYLGRLATTCGRFDVAARHLTAALAVHESIGAVPDIAATLCDRAVLQLRRDGRDGRRAAQRTARTASGIAQQAELPRLVRRAEALLHAANV